MAKQPVESCMKGSHTAGFNQGVLAEATRYIWGPSSKLRQATRCIAAAWDPVSIQPQLLAPGVSPIPHVRQQAPEQGARVRWPAGPWCTLAVCCSLCAPVCLVQSAQLDSAIVQR